MIKAKSGLQPKNLIIVAACANIAEILGITVTMTAGINGKHMVGSKHYIGDALDIRSKSMKVDKQLFLNEVMFRLGVDYQGFLESKNTDNEHFHIEYDPK